AGLFLLLLAASLLGIVSSLGYALLFFPITSGLLLLAYKKRIIYSGSRLEFLVESQFILAGLVGLAWALLI
ncbi:MAG: 4-hydroxy-3-methylbut-2-enyl diphosphate reductase, partial [Desulfosudaceae bacterium]